ncbi:hypothetical protein F7R20_17335 [Pseudomonas brassicacearum subsp. brassicacearum]|nr:hypothetical protein F7R20_17335 [Pseudomonas brassicacearum subsp. brassicacearum]QEO79547.1 hypothetical protein ELZ14_18990 [Pseudomonas brassicacearum]
MLFILIFRCVFFGGCISFSAVTAAGGSALTAGYFRLGRLPGFSKVTRRKGGTLSSRYRRNGYTRQSN